MPDHNENAASNQLGRIAAQLSFVEATMIDPREFGRLEGAVTALSNELTAVKTRQEAIDSKLDQVLARLSEASGGWKLLMALGGAGATLGGVITWLTTHIVNAPK